MSEAELRARTLAHDWTAEYTRALIERIELIKELSITPLNIVAKIVQELPTWQREECLWHLHRSKS